MLNDLTPQYKGNRKAEGVTIGTVIDTNDPQQMGRLRVLCPALMDKGSSEVGEIPWAFYMSPFGGTTDQFDRGPEQDVGHSPVAYGMWAIPKVGTQVLVMCIDGDPLRRVWIGCVHMPNSANTQPHGRYTTNSSVTSPGNPEGPLAADEKPIQPLYRNMQSAFGADRQNNFEWRTRGADFSASAVSSLAVASGDTFGKIADDTTSANLQGYGINQRDPSQQSIYTGNVYDSHVYSLTTPGFHAISMDDRSTNCRMRLRTTSGNQIILDDTNERIYVSTAEGKTWIQIDQKGNIDIFGAQEISVRAKKDINFYADQTFRVHAKTGIHLLSDNEVRITAKGGNGVQVLSDTAISLQSITTTDILSGTTLSLQSGTDTQINTATEGHWTTGSTMHHLAGGIAYFTSPDIHLNGPAAVAALSASAAFGSFEVSRLPDHEPWNRVYSDPASADQNTNNTYTPQLSPTDPLVDKIDRDKTPLGRNPNWRR